MIPIGGPVIVEKVDHGERTEWTHVTEHVLHDEDGMFGFYVRWSVAHHWANVDVFEIESMRAPDTDGAPPIALFAADEAHRPVGIGPCGTAASIAEAEKYLSGHVKWDGCAELNQRCPHWCGVTDFVRHVVLLRYIYERAFELMGRPPSPDGDNEPWPAALPPY